MSKPEIRFGVMVNGDTMQDWQRRCIEEVLAVPGTRLSLFIVNGARQPRGLRAALRRVPMRHLLYTLYARFFVRPAAARRLLWRPRFPGTAEVVCIAQRRKRYSEYFGEAEVSAIRDHDLDFIVRFGFGIIRGEVLKAARYGVWSFHHDDERKYRGMPAAFWSIWHDDPVSGLILQRLTDRLDGGVILRRASLRTKDTSLQENLNRVLLAGVPLVAQVCHDIGANETGYLRAEPSTTGAPVKHRPSNTETLAFLGKLLRNRVRTLMRPLLRQELWNVGVIRAPMESLLKAKTLPPVEWLPRRPNSSYIADPFVAESPDGSALLLYEDFDYATWRGAISATHLGCAGAEHVAEPGLALPSHLSYPYLFRHEGTLYCVPENASEKEVVLYRVDDSTGALERVATLLAGIAALDATVIRRAGRWWMFYTDIAAGASDRLFIQHAETLEGPWLPHAQNPVKTDIRSARPGGKPFVFEGALYRPAQDCAERYGARVRVQKIVRLTPDSFAEEEATILNPDPDGPYPHGLHTVSGCGELTVVDGKRELFIWPAFVGGMRRRLRERIRPHRHAAVPAAVAQSRPRTVSG